MRDVVIQLENKEEFVLVMNVIEAQITAYETENPKKEFDKILLKEQKAKWLFKILYKDKK